MDLDPWNQPPGSWRGTIMNPAKKFAKPAFDTVTTTFAAEDKKVINQWLGELRVQVSVGDRATPIDLVEAADALSLAAAIAFCDRVYEAALKNVKQVDADFEIDNDGKSGAYLKRAIEAIIDDSTVFGMVVRCMTVFELDGPDEVAPFITNRGFELSTEYQRSYAELCEDLHAMLNPMEDLDD